MSFTNAISILRGSLAATMFSLFTIVTFNAQAQTTNPFQQSAQSINEMLKFKGLISDKAQYLHTFIHENLWHKISNEIQNCKTSISVKFIDPHSSVKNLKDFEESLIVLEVSGCLKNSKPATAARNYISENYYSKAIEGFIELKQTENQVCLTNQISFVGITSNCSLKQELQTDSGDIYIRSSIISNNPKADSKLYLKESLVRFSPVGNNTEFRLTSYIRGEDIGFMLKSTVFDRINESQIKALGILEKLSQE